MPQIVKTSWNQKGWCNKPSKLQFQSIYKQNALKSNLYNLCKGSNNGVYLKMHFSSFI